MNQTHKEIEESLRKKWLKWEKSLEYSGDHNEIADWWLEKIEIAIDKAIAEERERIKIPFFSTGECEPWATKEQQEEQEIYAQGWNDCRNRVIEYKSILSQEKK